jgi:hypothetical protein
MTLERWQRESRRLDGDLKSGQLYAKPVIPSDFRTGGPEKGRETAVRRRKANRPGNIRSCSSAHGNSRHANNDRHGHRVRSIHDLRDSLHDNPRGDLHYNSRVRESGDRPHRLKTLPKVQSG